MSDQTRMWLNDLMKLDTPALAGIALSGLIAQYDNDPNKITEHIDRFVQITKETLN